MKGLAGCFWLSLVEIGQVEIDKTAIKKGPEIFRAFFRMPGSAGGCDPSLSLNALFLLMCTHYKSNSVQFATQLTCLIRKILKPHQK